MGESDTRMGRNVSARSQIPNSVYRAFMSRMNTCHKYSLHALGDKSKSRSDSPLPHKMAKEKREKGKKKIKLN